MDYNQFEGQAIWCHPVDIHLSTRGIQSWPKLQFQVWQQDSFGRNDLYGYGTCYIPSSPGFHQMHCEIWRPVGSLSDEISRHFLGGSLHLRDPETICDTGSELYLLRTAGMGRVYLELYVIHRNFLRYGIET